MLKPTSCFFSQKSLSGTNQAVVIVPEDQLSVAIGKAGQNVRLAGKLTGYELDVESDQAAKKEEAAPTPKESEPRTQPEADVGVESKPVVQKIKKKTELEDSLLKAIEEHATPNSEQVTGDSEQQKEIGNTKQEETSEPASTKASAAKASKDKQKAENAQQEPGSEQ